LSGARNNPAAGPPEAQDDDERKVLDDVRDYGWHAVGVEEDDEGPPFTYTVGLYHSFGHPEIIVLGVPPSIGFGILTNLADEIRIGREFAPGPDYAEILEAYAVRFIKVGQEFYHDYLGYDRWFYRREPFPVFQCVLPDREGRYPWDAECDAGLVASQPLLDARWIGLSQGE
jgi:hypothetical protein